MDFLKKVNEAGIVPVVVIENAEDAVPTARALLEGGIAFMEITLRTGSALEAISRVSTEVPEMNVGAGTVLSIEKAMAAVDAGANFIVSPGFDEKTVRWCIENNIPVIPGVATPTEIMAAINLGLNTVKFFPANIYGGIKALKALHSVFGDISFLPTGGVNQENLAEFVKEPYIIAIGGSWVCTKGDISSGRFEEITAKSKEAVKVIKEIKE